jgi:signal transduction histidine kinase
VLDRVEQAERGREREARAAVTEERMRVARELHDAVAHNVSVIAIQAAGADGILERDPGRAAECAALIESVAREALAELGRLTGAPAEEPAQPSLARVDALVGRARDAGLQVELRVEGEPEPLPAGVDLAAFRIVQEALANTAKHAGDARAWVVVRYAPRAVEVEVRDEGRGPRESAATANGAEPASPGAGGARAAGTGGHGLAGRANTVVTSGHGLAGRADTLVPSGHGLAGRADTLVTGGHGLVGMRERAALYGGTLDISGAPREGFAVRARLPVGRA